MMRVVVVTPPTPVVSLDEAKLHLRVDTSDEDDLIFGMVAAATAHIDGPSGWLGRAIGVQTLTAHFDNFGCGGLILPFPPIVCVTSVQYLASPGVEQTVDAALYETMGGTLVPKHGQTWPASLWRREAVRVTYQAGYAEAPAPIRAAILLMVGDLFRNRETVALGTIAPPIAMSMTVEALLQPYRMFR